MLRKTLVPTLAMYELTLQCNMQCLHCGSSAGKPRRTELTTKEWNTITRELATLNCKQIALLGGEPFLRKDWFEIAKTIRETDIEVSFMSNGLCINEDVVTKLHRLEPYTIVVSIDGGTAKTHDYIRQRNGSFVQCMKAIDMLRDANIPTTVITTLNKKNLQELPLLRSRLTNRGIVWQLQLGTPIGRFPKELVLSKEEFYAAALFIATTREKYGIKELPIVGAHCFGYFSKVLPNINLLPLWNGCQAGITVVSIQSDGGVIGCLSLPEKFIEGNIRETRLSDIWNNHDSFFYNRCFTLDDLTNECRGCQYGRTCKGGCLSVSVGTTDQRHGDPYCLQLIEKSFPARSH